MERRCKRCERTLPLEAFNRYKDGHQWWCRECFKAYFRDRGQRHLDQCLASREARRERAHAFVLARLSAAVCSDCGEPDPSLLEFDHLRDKLADIAKLVVWASRLDVIEAEMAKCEIVCCNCHRRRTYRRRGTTRSPVDLEGVTDWRVRRNLEWLYSYLRAASCVDCGLADPLVLEFDHIGLKRKSVMQMAWDGYGQDTIQIEMNKCEIRCANCHRRKTLVESNAFRHRTATAGKAPATLDPAPPL